MKTAAAYIRVSTEDQVEFSPDSQLEKIKLYAEKNQILLPKEFIFLDEHVIIGTSGENLVKSRVSALVPFQFFCKGKYSFI